MEIILAPRQLGYGTSLGCEAAVHAARCYVESTSSVSNKLMLKLDFKNAFNSLRRDKMLQLMGERLNLLCSHEHVRHSFAFTLRTAPCFLSGHLRSFDDILCST